MWVGSEHSRGGCSCAHTAACPAPVLHEGIFMKAATAQRRTRCLLTTTTTLSPSLLQPLTLTSPPSYDTPTLSAVRWRVSGRRACRDDRDAGVAAVQTERAGAVASLGQIQCGGYGAEGATSPQTAQHITSPTPFRGRRLMTPPTSSLRMALRAAPLRSVQSSHAPRRAPSSRRALQVFSEGNGCVIPRLLASASALSPSETHAAHARAVTT